MRGPWGIPVALLLGALLSVALPVPAQEAPGAPESSPDTVPTLTLEEAFELAERNNPRYRKARNRVDAAGAGVQEAWGAFLPSLSTSAGFGKNFSRSVRETDFFGNPIENDEVETVWTTSSNQSVNAGITLFDGGRRFHELGRARAEERAAAVEARSELTLVRADLEEAYREAQKQATLAGVESELLDSRRRDLEATERRFEVADADRVDVLAARLEVTRQEKRVEDARIAARRSVLALRRLVGVAEMERFRVSDEAPEFFDPSALHADSLVRAAWRQNPGLRSLEATLRARDAGVSSAKSGRWPSLDFSASFRRSEFGHRNEALFLLDPANQGGGFSLSISVPVFQRFRTSGAIARAEVQRRDAREDVRQKELEIEEDVRAGLLELRNARRGVEISERAVEIARERLRLERERYRLGVSAFLDLQEAVTAAADARRQAVEARYDFATARTALERVVGGPVGPSGGR